MDKERAWASTEAIFAAASEGWAIFAMAWVAAGEGWVAACGGSFSMVD